MLAVDAAPVRLPRVVLMEGRFGVSSRLAENSRERPEREARIWGAMIDTYFSAAVTPEMRSVRDTAPADTV